MLGKNDRATIKNIIAMCHKAGYLFSLVWVGGVVVVVDVPLFILHAVHKSDVCASHSSSCSIDSKIFTFRSEFSDFFAAHDSLALNSLTLSRRGRGSLLMVQCLLTCVRCY